MRREKIFGLHAVRSVLAHEPDQVQVLHVVSGKVNARLQELVTLAMANSITVDYCPRRELDQLVSGRHQGVVAVVGVQPVQQFNDLGAFLEGLDHHPFLLVLDGVTDPHNLGACMRSANAAGVDALITPKDKSVGITPVVRKVASGAVEATPLFQVTNLARTLEQLKAVGVWIYGLSDAATQTLYEIDLRGPLALVLGAEGKGIRRLTAEKCDALLSIPMHGSVSSLNVSVATGVSLFEAVRQRG